MSYNIKNTFKAIPLIAFGVLTFASCSDTWDEHYDSSSPVSEHSYAGTTLSYIKENASDFADVIAAAGYESILNTSQVFTILAPADGSFNKDSLMQLINAGHVKNVRERFIQNHVMLYNASLTNQQKTYNRLNLKKIQFGTLDNNSIGSVSVLTPNVACRNGVVHVLNGNLPYNHNVYEEIEAEHDAYLARTGLDEADVVDMYNFLKVYDVDSLDERQSVEIGTDSVGNTVYSDSVMIRNNQVLRSLRAYLYREDSTYWAILPSTEAYKERVDVVKNYFKFNNALNDNESFRDSLQNYYANYYTINDLFFNRNTNSHYADSLTTTSYGSSNWKYDVYYKPFDEGGVLADLEPVECSNGVLYKSDAVPNSIYDAFFREIKVEATQGSIVPADDWTQSSTYSASFNSMNNDSVSNGFLIISEVASSRNTTVAFRIPNTCSGKYDIYVKLLPYSLVDTVDTVQMQKPVQFRANLFEADARNTMPTRETLRLTTPDGNRNFQSNPFRADTIFLGTYDFSYCYRHTGQAGVYLQLQGYLTTAQRNTLTRTMLLDFILLKPHREEATEPEDSDND